MSPTKREYWAQFVPNWNSMTMPVATPTAKVMAKSLPKNLATWTYTSSCFFQPNHSAITSSQASPMEMGGKMKWNPTVTANWIRASVSASMKLSPFEGRGRLPQIPQIPQSP